MKTMKIFLNKICFVMATVLIAAMITIAGCDSSGGGGDDYELDPFHLSGTFKNENGKDVEFFVKRDESSSNFMYRSARAAIDHTDYFLSGYLEDEGTVYELFGYYSPLSESYALCASAADGRYNLYGFYDPDLEIAASGEAIVLSGPDGDWAASEPLEVSPLSAAPAIAGSPEESENGFPLAMQGNWFKEEDADACITLNAFSSVYTYYVEKRDRETWELTGVFEWAIGPMSLFFSEVWLEDEDEGIYAVMAPISNLNLYNKAAFKIVDDRLFESRQMPPDDYEAVKNATDYDWLPNGYTRVSP